MKENTAYWVLKSVLDKDVSYIGNDGYDDEIEKKYEYDDTVANHRQIKTGDIAVIVDKQKVLGIAKISRILIYNTTKERRRCPECGNTNYERRKTKLPEYRCNKGHEFDSPTSEIIDITKYEAFYSDSFRHPSIKLTVDKIRPYFKNNYNRNMSMQSLSVDFFKNYFDELLNDLNSTATYPSAHEANHFLSDLMSDDYIPNGNDERALIFKAIMQRRGQQKFRDAIRAAYGDKCMITGCEVLEVLEAAHINPYRGEKDNHVSNGLLLRSDIHTLFDLDLIGIEPDKHIIHLSKNLHRGEYQELSGNKLRLNLESKISKVALDARWRLFLAEK